MNCPRYWQQPIWSIPSPLFSYPFTNWLSCIITGYWHFCTRWALPLDLDKRLPKHSRSTWYALSTGLPQTGTFMVSAESSSYIILMLSFYSSRNTSNFSRRNICFLSNKIYTVKKMQMNAYNFTSQCKVVKKIFSNQQNFLWFKEIFSLTIYKETVLLVRF